MSLKAIENRLERVNMNITSILKPYVRANRKPSKPYTSFCVSDLTNSELKNKYSRNGVIRMGEFTKMV